MGQGVTRMRPLRILLYSYMWENPNDCVVCAFTVGRRDTLFFTEIPVEFICGPLTARITYMINFRTNLQTHNIKIVSLFCRCSAFISINVKTGLFCLGVLILLWHLMAPRFFPPLWVTNRSTVLLAFTVKARSLCLWSYFSYVWQVDTALSHEVICLLQDCHKGHAILFFLHFSVQTQMYWRHIDLKHLMQYLKLYITISDVFMVNVLRRVWMVYFLQRPQVQVQVCF